MCVDLPSLRRITVYQYSVVSTSCVISFTTSLSTALKKSPLHGTKELSIKLSSSAWTPESMSYLGQRLATQLASVEISEKCVLPLGCTLHISQPGGVKNLNQLFSFWLLHVLTDSDSNTTSGNRYGQVLDGYFHHRILLNGSKWINSNIT